jgi:superfamily I DNA/RNA helicase
MRPAIAGRAATWQAKGWRMDRRTFLAGVLASSFPWCSRWATELKQLFAAYVEAKQHQNVVDYDDLLLCWSHMMGDSVLASEIGGRFDHVLVDEYQDTNRLQSSILFGLKPTGSGLTVVGDARRQHRPEIWSAPLLGTGCELQELRMAITIG